MSLYSEYLLEKTKDKIIETEKGFITYRYVDEKTVYIVDLYVRPDFRNKYVASGLADEVVLEAKSKGCNGLLGSVVPSNKNSSQSVEVLLSYGMRLHSSTNDFIMFRKDI